MTVTALTKTNQNELERHLPKSSFKYYKPTLRLIVIPMGRISRELPTWQVWAREWHKSGFKTVEHARKSTKVPVKATGHLCKHSFQSYLPIFAWQRKSQRPRETRLFIVETIIVSHLFHQMLKRINFSFKLNFCDILKLWCVIKAWI